MTNLCNHQANRRVSAAVSPTNVFKNSLTVRYRPNGFKNTTAVRYQAVAV